MRSCGLVLLGGLALGCGGGGGGPDADRADGARPDARRLDAEPIPPDAYHPPDGVYRFVIDSVTVPATAPLADQLGFDLDGDGTIDNQFGQILAALRSASGSDPQPGVDARVDRGEILLLAAVRPCDDGTCLSTYQGANPVPAPCTDPEVLATCRQHLQGTASFDLDVAAPTDTRVDGVLGGGTFTGGPGTLLVPVAVFDEVVVVEVVRARAALRQVTGTAFTASKLGGGVPAVVIDDAVIPALHRSIVAVVAADCTGLGETCGCRSGSTAETMLAIFDDDADCAVSVDEVRDNAVIRTLFRPDLDTDGDGEADALSIGVGVTGIAASFEVP
jgi:hypothetical protein